MNVSRPFSLSSIALSAAFLSMLSSQAALAQLTQQGPKLTGTGGLPAENQGSSVAVSADGNTAVVGGPNDNGNDGAAWVYTRSGGVWSQQGGKLVGTGAVGGANQGWSVAVSADGNTAIAGGLHDNGNLGAAWVYMRSSGVWTQQGGKLVGTGTVGAALQGSSVALSDDGDTAVVGGFGDNAAAGALWVYTRSGGVWTQQGAKLVGTGAVGGAAQGYSAALSGDGNTAAAGGSNDNGNVGAAWVFIRSGGVWSQQGGKLVGSGAAGAASQGYSVGVSEDGDTAVVGGPNDNGNVGAAWVFTRSGGVWSQQGAKLVGTGALGSANQGWSVAADGDTAIVGGPDDNGSVGAAWVYTRSGGVWSQQGAKLIGTGALGGANQGNAVALSDGGNTAIVGGRSDNGGVGAAWVFAQPVIVSGFIPVTPCRVADTRNANGPFGGPSMGSGASRTFAIPSSSCGIPSTATAYSLNVTVVPHGPLSYLTVWPSGQTQPFVSTLNSPDGRIKADAAIVPAGSGGAISVFVTDPTDVVLDIDGYFVAAGSGGDLAFYPLSPCRISDTRNAVGPNGGPTMLGGQTRTIPTWNVCSVPTSAQALSLNYTVVPQGGLAFLTTWPTGQSQPLVSTLNAPTGTVVANAAIVPTGTGGNGGKINVFVTNTTDVVIDVNGYFAPAGIGGLSFYAATPCRILDTRNAPGAFGGPAMAGGGTRAFAVPASACSIPFSAQAYSLNATVVPSGGLGYLTLWPAGIGQPLVSTLNAQDGSLTSNAAIVPAGTGGAIDAFVTNTTDLILDINGYFAP